MRYCLAIILSILCFGSFAQTRVVLIPTLHGLHKTNAHYDYDSLRRIIMLHNPDVLCVEMRSIDVASDTDYLKKNYPYEMWMARYWFPGKRIEGFDWLGEELEGKPIPQGYWQNGSHIKDLERKLDADSSQSLRLYACQQYTEERLEILKHGSLDDILSGKDAELTKQYYQCLNDQLSGGKYGELVGFYEKRDRQIQLNVDKIIKENRGKKIVILTGDDHFPYLMEYLKGKGILLLPAH